MARLSRLTGSLWRRRAPCRAYAASLRPARRWNDVTSPCDLQPLTEEEGKIGELEVSRLLLHPLASSLVHMKGGLGWSLTSQTRHPNNRFDELKSSESAFSLRPHPPTRLTCGRRSSPGSRSWKRHVSVHVRRLSSLPAWHPLCDPPRAPPPRRLGPSRPWVVQLRLVTALGAKRPPAGTRVHWCGSTCSSPLVPVACLVISAL